MNIAWIFTVLTLAGTILAIYKKWYCFLIFTVTNVFWFIHDINHGLYAQSAIFVGFTIINIFGSMKWLKEVRKGVTLVNLKKQL